MPLEMFFIKLILRQMMARGKRGKKQSAKTCSGAETKNTWLKMFQSAFQHRVCQIKKTPTIAFMPGRLEGLENFVWKDYLNCSAYVLNDGVAALVAEAKTGAAKNSTNAIMITLGTGVGGALLINKQPYQGSFNKAGHIGHMVIDSNGDADVTNMPGSLEECIGNCTVEKRSKGKFTSTHELLDAYRNKDEIASQVWLVSVKKLAIGLASASNFISPDTIVVGGGIAEANDDLFIPLNKWFDEFEWQPGGFGHKL
jgi:glucokinase